MTVIVKEYVCKYMVICIQHVNWRQMKKQTWQQWDGVNFFALFFCTGMCWQLTVVVGVDFCFVFVLVCAGSWQYLVVGVDFFVFVLICAGSWQYLVVGVDFCFVFILICAGSWQYLVVGVDFCFVFILICAGSWQYLVVSVDFCFVFILICAGSWQ